MSSGAVPATRVGAALWLGGVLSLASLGMIWYADDTGVTYGRSLPGRWHVYVAAAGVLAIAAAIGRWGHRRLLAGAAAVLLVVTLSRTLALARLLRRERGVSGAGIDRPALVVVLLAIGALVYAVHRLTDRSNAGG